MVSRLFPFGWGNVTKLSIAYFFSTLYFYAPVMTLYLQNRGLDYVEINSLWGIIVGTMFLTEVPTGVLADRLGRKGAINAALALQTVGEIVFIFARSYWSFAAAAVIGGLGFACGSGSVEALVYDSLQSENRADEMSKAMGVIAAAQRLANLIAFGIGGVLAANLSQERFVVAIAVTACSVAVGWMTSLKLKEPQTAKEKKGGESLLRLMVDGARMLRHNAVFRGLVLFALATIPFRDYLMNLYQPRFVETGVPPVWLGLGLALASGLGVVSARFAYRIEARLGASMSMLLITGLPGVLYLLLAVLVHPVGVVLVFCLLLGSQSLKDPIFSGRLNQHIDSKNRATVLSMISMFSGVYVALMGLLIGRVANISLTYAFAFMGLVILIGVVGFRVNDLV